MLRRHQPLDRDRAQVDDQEPGLILERFRRRLIDRRPVPRSTVLQAEKHGLAHGRERTCLGQSEQCLRLAGLAQHHELATDQIGSRVGLVGGEPAVIAAISRAVEWVGDITEKRPRSEVEHA